MRQRRSDGVSMRTRLLVLRPLAAHVLENGGVREEGRHDELVAADGLYAKLCRLQFGDAEAN